MERTFNVESTKPYLVVGQYLTYVEMSPFKKDHLRIMGQYVAHDPNEAFQMFLDEYTKDVSRAQLFYNDVWVIPLVSEKGYKYQMSEVFGELAKFPNPNVIMTEE